MFRMKNKLKSDIAFDVFNFIVLGGFTLIILYPLYFIVIASISDPNQIYAGNVWLWPKAITFDGYQRIFSDNTIWTGYRNSLFYAALTAVISSVLTVMAAYPLSRKDLYGRNAFMMIFAVTLFLTGNYPDLSAGQRSSHDQHDLGGCASRSGGRVRYHYRTDVLPELAR